MSTIPTSASSKFNNFKVTIFPIFEKKKNLFTIYFGESPVMVNQFSYCRTRLTDKNFKFICLDKPTLSAVGLIKKRGSINDTILNRRLI